MIEKTKELQANKLEFIKSPSVLEFIDLPANMGYTEDELEKAIVDNIQKFLLELGKGYAFVEKQKNAKWGTGFLQQVSQDLRDEFPDVKGFSYRNIRIIKQWHLFYNKNVTNLATGCCQIEKDDNANCGASCSTFENSKRVTGCNPIEQDDNANLATSCSQIETNDKFKQNIFNLFLIPWGHNQVIISKCNFVKKALFYVNKTIQNGWSRAVLTLQVKSDLYEREGQAITTFSKTLPDPQSELAHQILKSPYNFDFLTLTEDFKERELEFALLEHIETALGVSEYELVTAM